MTNTYRVPTYRAPGLAAIAQGAELSAVARLPRPIQALPNRDLVHLFRKDNVHRAVRVAALAEIKARVADGRLS